MYQHSVCRFIFIPVGIAMIAFAVCGCVSAVPSPQPPAGIPSQSRRVWRTLLETRYGTYLPSEDETVRVFNAALDRGGERETYGGIMAVLEKEAVMHEGRGVLDPVWYALHNPFALPQIGRDVTLWSQRLVSAGGGAPPGPDQIIRDFASDMERLLGENTGSAEAVDPPVQEKPDLRVDNLGASIYKIASTANRRAKEAYKEISASEMSFLLQKSEAALVEFSSRNNIFENMISEDGQFMLSAILRKFNFAPLADALRILAALLEPEIIQTCRQLNVPLKTARELGISPRFLGNFIYARQTPVGLMLVGGRGPNTYGDDAAVIIDLGGDDVYTANAGASRYAMENHVPVEVVIPIGLVVDLAGNDRYVSPRFSSMGAGLMGLGLLVDLEGDDVYAGQMLTQGAGFMGAGCLVDMKGNDTYKSACIGQGAAIFGAGLLFDGEGDDLFVAAKYAQGLGGPGGAGELIDLKGNDQYVLGGRFGSSYGARDIFQGYGQGAGWGWRGHVGGGLGVLYDQRGDDVYEAGNFAQGTGYYLGMGVLRDDSGNDRYWGSRYCQGAAAHQAAGILMDLAGDDVYAGQIAANQGAAWDVSVAGCYDYSGNDQYTGADLSVGAAEQNGIGLFYDGQGNDGYMIPGQRSLGFGGATTYGGGRGAANIGVFIDTGGARDSYPDGWRQNNVFSVVDNVGIFLDQ